MSVGCFYIIVAQGRGPMGRFILLTYNLSALYAYSLSVKDDENDDDEGGTDPHIFPITLHRVVAVMSGCIWGMIITRLIWPISARSKLKNGLSRLWLRMGLIWKRDPLSSLLEYSSPSRSQYPMLTFSNRGSQPTAYMNLREELQLQSYIAQLRTLRASAVSEFELRGPFPEKSFSTIMEMTSDMLDAFHAMNAVIIKDLKATPGETRILEYTAQQRRQLSSRISHLFQVLASSMKLEYPINNALPSIDHTRDRLLARTFEFRKAEEGNENITDEDFGLLYAYALVTAQLAADIEAIGDEIESLFGVFDEDLLKSQ
ncbi:MAG: hypothetical protein M1814_000350 [Vezdaea aestivalis]|nr:MAG: hypothetical protein M1814_000350 [Vezdaea aestivalis]